MKRIAIEPRKDWQTKVQNLGLKYYDQAPDGVYWNESAYYSFSEQEIDNMFHASKTLFNLCMEAIDKIIENDWFHRFGIDRNLAQSIIDSWDEDAPTLYGRFDLTIGKDGNYKMLEFNADTATSVFESSAVQWSWKEEQFVNNGQYNDIHQTLINQFRYIDSRIENQELLYFTCGKTCEEDRVNTEYLMSVALDAGISTKFVYIDDIGLTPQDFVDEAGYTIFNVFKLYPWEWILSEPFGKAAFTHIDMWIEPVWKLLLSNKAILPILWELFPNHPNLLPAYFYTDETSSKLQNKVIKPFYSREGANIVIRSGSEIYDQTSGMYDTIPKVEQEFCELPQFDGKYACLGSWIVGDHPCGLGIRETDRLITDGESKFVPHIIEN